MDFAFKQIFLDAGWKKYRTVKVEAEKLFGCPWRSQVGAEDGGCGSGEQRTIAGCIREGEATAHAGGYRSEE